jgi:hypothetical protein
MVEVTNGYTTRRAKTTARVGYGTSYGDSDIWIENYSDVVNTRNESTVIFVFDRALYLGSNGTTPIEEGYDLKQTGNSYFSVRVSGGAVSTNDSYIARAEYSQERITVTLSGLAADPLREVTVELNRDFYDSNGRVVDTSYAPIAYRKANTSQWQDYAYRDITPPTIEVAGSGNTSIVLRMQLDEPLGYTTNGITRPMPNSYNIFDLGGTTGFFSVKVDGLLSNEQLITSARYSLSERAIVVTIEGVPTDSFITLALLRELQDIYGNKLTLANMGVFFRRARETTWYKALNQAEADLAASGQTLDGSIVLVGQVSNVTENGVVVEKLKLGQAISIDMTNLSVTKDLTITWRFYNDAVSPTILTSATGSTVTLNTVNGIDVAGLYVTATVTSTMVTGAAVSRKMPIDKRVTTAVPINKTVKVGEAVTVASLFTVTGDGAKSYWRETPTAHEVLTPTTTFDSTGTYNIWISVAAGSKYYALVTDVKAVVTVTGKAPVITPKETTKTVTKGVPLDLNSLFIFTEPGDGLITYAWKPIVPPNAPYNPISGTTWTPDVAGTFTLQLSTPETAAYAPFSTTITLNIIEPL